MSTNLSSKTFAQIYKESLHNLGLVEGSDGNKTFIGKKRFFGLLSPRIIGEVKEKPRQTTNGLDGEFRVISYNVRSLMWDLAEAIETNCGIESEVEISVSHRI